MCTAKCIDKQSYTLISMETYNISKYICNYTFVMMKLQFNTFKMLTLNLILNNSTIKMIIKYCTCALVC